MRVSDFDDFDRLETEGLLTGSKERSWLWFGLIVSLGIHLALCAYFYRTRFQTIEALSPANVQTPTFKVRSINASDLGKSSVDQTNPAAKPNPDNTDVQLPDEKKSFDKLLQDIQSSAALPDDMRDVLPDQPKVEQPEVNSVLTEIERSTAQSLAPPPKLTPLGAEGAACAPLENCRRHFEPMNQCGEQIGLHVAYAAPWPAQ